MIENLAARLQAVDPALLADVVRQDQRSQAFEIADWAVGRLSNNGANSPDGLWLFSGSGGVGGAARPWSVVLKIIERPQQEQAPEALGYWKREVLLVQSGMLERLPGPARHQLFHRRVCQSHPRLPDQSAAQPTSARGLPARRGARQLTRRCTARSGGSRRASRSAMGAVPSVGTNE